MKIVVTLESSSASRTEDVMNALKGYGHETSSISSKDSYQLNYMHTALISALLLNAKRADLIVGGCGTGHGFNIAVSQYPGIFCSLIIQPVDIWLSMQINVPNCISLVLNKGYGWVSDVNLKFIFEKMFSITEPGCGFPKHRKELQKEARKLLADISVKAHVPMAQALKSINHDFVKYTLLAPGMKELLEVDVIEDADLKKTLQDLYASY